MRFSLQGGDHLPRVNTRMLWWVLLTFTWLAAAASFGDAQNDSEAIKEPVDTVERLSIRVNSELY